MITRCFLSQKRSFFQIRSIEGTFLIHLRVFNMKYRGIVRRLGKRKGFLIGALKLSL